MYGGRVLVVDVLIAVLCVVVDFVVVVVLVSEQRGRALVVVN